MFDVLAVGKIIAAFERQAALLEKQNDNLGQLIDLQTDACEFLQELCVQEVEKETEGEADGDIQKQE